MAEAVCGFVIHGHPCNSCSEVGSLLLPIMEIKRSGSNPSGKGPADWFTGTVRIDPLFSAPAPARVAGAHVTFEPGARTAWHTHPLGQTLVVTFGVGRVQRWGGPVEEIRPGDVVWFPPGENHWRGATPDNAMTHIAIHEVLGGKAVDWLEKVTDAQYAGSSNSNKKEPLCPARRHRPTPLSAIPARRSLAMPARVISKLQAYERGA